MNPAKGQGTTMQLNDFAVQVHRDGNAWAWKVIDEDGAPTRRGLANSAQEAQQEALRTADSLSRFRAVTKGGW